MTDHSSKKQPWQTLSSEIKYDNAWIRVEEDQVINPAGKPGIYGRVIFKNRAVAVLPIDDEGNTWLVGQYRYPLKQYHWELPMGGAPEHEDLLACAQRELKEETGLTALHYEVLLEMHLSNSITQEYGIVYLARELSLGDMQQEDCEDLAVKKVPLSEVFARVMAGEITDAITVAAILKAKLLNYF